MSDGVPNTPLTCVSTRRHTIQKGKYQSKIKSQKNKNRLKTKVESSPLF